MQVSDLLKEARDKMMAGGLVEAEKLIKKAMKKKPGSTAPIFWMGTLEFRHHNYQRAIELLEDVVKRQPDSIDAHVNLAASYNEVGRLQDAIEHYRFVLEKEPENYIVLSNIGAVYKKMNRFNDALVYLNKSLEVNPDYWIVRHNLGGLHMVMKNYDQAIEQYKEALRLNEDPNVYASLIGALKMVHSPESYEMALKVTGLKDPGLALLSAYPVIGANCDWQKMSEIKDDVFRIAEREKGQEIVGLMQGLLLPMNRPEDISSNALFDLHRDWGNRASKYIKPYVDHKCLKHASAKIRIAYLSPDFKEHSVGHFIQHVIASHNHEKFEIVCYSNSKVDDDVTKNIKKSCHLFAKIYNLTDEELAQRIVDDEIHMLIDLSGHTGDSRVSVMRYKPAPVQITYLGYPNTTGLGSVDYRITDHFSESGKQKYTEQLIYMPESFICFGEFNDREISSELAAKRNGYITFGSFNNVGKITPTAIRVWSEILNRVEGSRLIVKSGNVEQSQIQKNVINEFAKYGIHEDRLELRGYHVEKNNHLDYYNEVDIALDTFPYNGTTTTCEALWMGVPVLTLVGDVHAQRVSYSILKNIGIEEIIAYSEEQYIDIALQLANDIERLEKLHKLIPVQLKSSILCDPDRFTRQLETLYQDAWKEKMSVAPWELFEGEENSTDYRLDKIDVMPGTESGVTVPCSSIDHDDYLYPEFSFISLVFKPGMTVVDMDAGYGVISIEAAKQVQLDGSVYSLLSEDCDPGYLRNNIHLIQQNNIHIIDENPAVFAEGRLSFDRLKQQFKLGSVDFINLGNRVENQALVESNHSFFENGLSLIMLDIRSGQVFDVGPVKYLRQIGYESFRYVQGLNCLVPFDESTGIDLCQQIVFMCKPDKAEMLEEQGLVLRDTAGDDDHELPPAGLWIDAMQNMPYVNNMITAWSAYIEKNASSVVWQKHQQALDYYFHSKQVDRSLVKRHASLQCAYQVLFEILKSDASFSNLLSFIRVAFELGNYKNAIFAYDYVMSVLDSDQSIALDEPFLCVHHRYDTLSPDNNLDGWLKASILELRELFNVMSSRVVDSVSREQLNRLYQTGFITPAMERRRQYMNWFYDNRESVNDDEPIHGEDSDAGKEKVTVETEPAEKETTVQRPTDDVRSASEAVARLHIGGKQPHPDWKILNAIPGPEVDYVGNAKDLSQFEDNTFGEIYGSHVLEHFDYARELIDVLKEWRRALKPGGKLYISVPDLDKLAYMFLQKDKLDFGQRFHVMRMIFGGQLDDYDFHKVGFNDEILGMYLREAGFENIKVVDEFGIFEDTSSFNAYGIKISLNVTAEKPAQSDSKPKKILTAKQSIDVFDDDIFLVSYPRSGNTWLRFLLAMIVKQATDVDFNNIERYIPDIYRNDNDTLLKIGSPRIIKSHEKYNTGYPNVIYLVRDVRDVIVSNYHFGKKMGYEGDFSSCFNSLITEPYDKGLAFGTWTDNVQSWLDHKDNLSLIKYESLVNSPLQAVTNLLSNLSIQVENTIIEHAIAECSFEKMRAKEQTTQGIDYINASKGNEFIRKGEVGGWREYFTPEHVDVVKERFGELLIALNYEKDDNWSV
ncbi:MAG: sulfotransferase domain-containing protein [Gammaproteobacteria bacterium]